MHCLELSRAKAVTYTLWFFHGCWVVLIPPVVCVPVLLFSSLLLMWKSPILVCVGLWAIIWMNELDGAEF